MQRFLKEANKRMILKKISVQEYPGVIWKDTRSGHNREVIHAAGEESGGHRKEYKRRKTKTGSFFFFFLKRFILQGDAKNSAGESAWK